MHLKEALRCIVHCGRDCEAALAAAEAGLGERTEAVRKAEIERLIEAAENGQTCLEADFTATESRFYTDFSLTAFKKSMAADKANEGVGAVVAGMMGAGEGDAAPAEGEEKGAEKDVNMGGAAADAGPEKLLTSQDDNGVAAGAMDLSV
jgi:hypothetical protein